MELIRLPSSSSWLVCASAGSLPPPGEGRRNRIHLCSMRDPTGLITHTIEADASGFCSPRAPLW